MYTNPDKPLLTLAQVRAWQAKATELAELIRCKTEERATLVRRIDAAKALIESLPDDEQVSMLVADIEAAHPMSVPEVVIPPAQIVDQPTPDESIPAAVLVAVVALGGARS